MVPRHALQVSHQLRPLLALEEARDSYGTSAIVHEHEGSFFALVSATTAAALPEDEPFDLPSATLGNVLARHRIPPALLERLETAGDGIGECETRSSWRSARP